MNSTDQRGDFPEKSSREAAHRNRRIDTSNTETQHEEDLEASPTLKEEDQLLPVDATSFAYQLLLLQQRLVAYEQLHLEEIAELRQEIEQLRRAFLQETSPQLRAITPVRNKE